MGELEDQIARLAQARADQVPPYEAPASLDRARTSRRGVWFAVAAAITAIVVAAGALLWDRGDDPSVRTAPTPATDAPAPTTVAPTTPTTPPTTAPPVAATCPGDAIADTSAKSGSGHILAKPGNGALGRIQILASGCTDEAVLKFSGGTPNWSLEYRSGPLTLEPSGQPFSMEGQAFLVVRLEHAEGLRAGGAPSSVLAGPLSHITEVRQTQDFEGIVTLVIGLDATMPFAVSDRSDADNGRIAVSFPETGEARAVRCAIPEDHVEVFAPAGWYTELNEDVRCHYFGPEPFEILRNTDARVPVALHVSTSSIANELRGSAVSSPAQTADDHRGECFEAEVGNGGLYPGTRSFTCIIGWGDGQFLTVVTYGYSGAQFETNKAGVQAIVASARYLP